MFVMLLFLLQKSKTSLRAKAKLKNERDAGTMDLTLGETKKQREYMKEYTGRTTIISATTILVVLMLSFFGTGLLIGSSADLGFSTLFFLLGVMFLLIFVLNVLGQRIT